MAAWTRFYCRAGSPPFACMQQGAVLEREPNSSRLSMARERYKSVGQEAWVWLQNQRSRDPSFLRICRPVNSAGLVPKAPTAVPGMDRMANQLQVTHLDFFFGGICFACRGRERGERGLVVLDSVFLGRIEVGDHWSNFLAYIFKHWRGVKWALCTRDEVLKTWIVVRIFMSRMC